MNERENYFNSSGEVGAYLDRGHKVFYNNEKTYETVRTSHCHLLTKNTRCDNCTHYRDTIRSMYNRWVKQQHQGTYINSHSHVNDQWLSTPQKKEKALDLKSELKKSTKKNQYLEQKIKEPLAKDSIEIDQDLNSGLEQKCVNTLMKSAAAIKRIVFSICFGKNN